MQRRTGSAPAVRSPGSGKAGAKLHHARAVTRRAEHRAVVLANDQPANETSIAYLNRLPDALFVIARAVNKRDGGCEENPTY